MTTPAELEAQAKDIEQRASLYVKKADAERGAMKAGQMRGEARKLFDEAKAKREQAQALKSRGYPYQPAKGKTDTSRKASDAALVKFNKNQCIVLGALQGRDLTNSEIFAKASGLNQEQLARYYELRALERGLQPRAGEMAQIGRVFDSGTRRKNHSNNQEIVWSLTDPQHQRQSA